MYAVTGRLVLAPSGENLLGFALHVKAILDMQSSAC